MGMKFMFNEYMGSFKTVVDLAKKFEEAYNEEIKEGLHDFSLSEMDQFLENQSKCTTSESYGEELESVLNSLDFEAIKTLQVIMYLGRDEDYNPKQTPEEIYRDYRNYFDKQGWKTKSIEIGQMTEKFPLGSYLENGFSILGITF